MMRRLQFLSTVLSVFALMLNGCAGGSGSSGFDVGFAENAAISEAIMTQSCVDVTHSSLTICPADVSMPRGGPGGVETGLDHIDAIPCSTAGSGVCSFSLPFMPLGLPSGALYRIATRSVEPLGNWRIDATAPQQNPAPGAPDFDVPAVVERPPTSSAPQVRVQVAILVYLQAPESIPSSIANLSDSGADFAYISEVTIQG